MPSGLTAVVVNDPPDAWVDGATPRCQRCEQVLTQATAAERRITAFTSPQCECVLSASVRHAAAQILDEDVAINRLTGEVIESNWRFFADPPILFCQHVAVVAVE